MIDVKDVTESFVVGVVVVLLNGIFHYALYRATVTLIMLIKDQVTWIFPKLKFGLPRDTNAALPNMSPSLPYSA
ncbi:hypothetical protein EAI_17252 [Harpegnathos saltator]|uniref:Uncharacterized protein n=1 Tax=Harpegnathos saltator TaxID=610380 RepID=E2B803_HARSA|nr:hypothetical protein EAI_17252 [Harpegnathos saltator]